MDKEKIKSSYIITKNYLYTLCTRHSVRNIIVCNFKSLKNILKMDYHSSDKTSALFKALQQVGLRCRDRPLGERPMLPRDTTMTPFGFFLIWLSSHFLQDTKWSNRTISAECWEFDRNKKGSGLQYEETWHITQDSWALAETKEGRHDRKHFILIYFILHLNSMQRGSHHCLNCFVSSLLVFNT